MNCNLLRGQPGPITSDWTHPPIRSRQRASVDTRSTTPPHSLPFHPSLQPAADLWPIPTPQSLDIKRKFLRLPRLRADRYNDVRTVAAHLCYPPPEDRTRDVRTRGRSRVSGLVLRQRSGLGRVYVLRIKKRAWPYLVLSLSSLCSFQLLLIWFLTPGAVSLLCFFSLLPSSETPSWSSGHPQLIAHKTTCISRDFLYSFLFYSIKFTAPITSTQYCHTGAFLRGSHLAENLPSPSPCCHMSQDHS